ncbi:MAG: hypothetical protein AAF624_12750 [Bacteroidota bacterium]
MTTLSHYKPLALLCALAIGVVGCDLSSVDSEPLTGFCAVDASAFGCPESGTVYDTLGADINGRTVIEVTDRQGGIGGALSGAAHSTVTWSNNFTYLLDGAVFVNSGQTLVIEPGTIIRGHPGQGRNSSALIVARGGRIEANGTAEAPIIMTAINDDVTDPSDLLQAGGPAQGEWGGLIVLGAAPTNIAEGETPIEGLDATDPRGLYGGSDPNDDSGVLRYVSIRHGGTLIGAGNEINGLTLGAVGAGTTIEYIEIFANQDDGIEWFGGTARAKYLLVSYSGDDMFDYDLGYSGLNQYVLGIMDVGFGDNGAEQDGGDSDLGGAAGEAATPLATPVFANVTYIGQGVDEGGRAMTFRDNAGGQYWRSVFYDFENGVRIEDREGEGDSRARAEAGDIRFTDVLFSNVVSASPTFDEVFAYYEDAPEGDTAVDLVDLTGPFNFGASGLSVQRSQGGPLSLSTSSVGAPTVPFPAAVADFFEETDFVGAVGDNNWIEGWTALSQYHAVN